MTTRLRITINESRSGLEETFVVLGPNNHKYSCGIFTSPDHTRLRFAKDENKLTEKSGYDFEIIFRESDEQLLEGFKKLVDKLTLPTGEAEAKEEEEKPEEPVEEGTEEAGGVKFDTEEK